MGNHENLSDVEIRDILERRVQDISAQIEKLRMQLRKAELALGAYAEDVNPNLNVDPKLRFNGYESATAMVKEAYDYPLIAKLTTAKLTTAGRMEYVLGKYRLPLTSSEFFKAYNENFPEKQVSQESWSSQLSVIYRDDKRNFQRIEFRENPQETRFFYALKDWFVDGELKPDYLKRLANKHKIIANNALFK